MRLDLRFSDRPLECLWCEAVVALVFKGPDLPGGMLSGLDDKMAGFLAYLEEKGFWTGTRGETILLASQNAIRADKIMLKGLGESTDCDTKALADRVREVGTTFDRVDIREFGIHIPVVEGFEEEYPSHLELSARHLVAPFLKSHQNESDIMLKIVFSVKKCTSDILNPVATRLREYFASLLDCSIVVSLEREHYTKQYERVMGRYEV